MYLLFYETYDYFQNIILYQTYYRAIKYISNF